VELNFLFYPGHAATLGLRSKLVNAQSLCGWSRAHLAPDVPEGQNLNSRGREPTEKGNKPLRPLRGRTISSAVPWVAPTAIHVWPLRGPPGWAA
jgi:hypothetical protein